MTDLDTHAIENKLTAARTKLILDKPFLGALVLRLPLQQADPAWCVTTGTDARKFYYNPHFIEALKPAETQFILAHEALHCALSHFARREHRVKHRWDLACDYAINPILINEGLTPPPGILLLKQYEGMSAEEIYPLIADNDMNETLDQHLYDKDDQFAEGGQDSSDNPLDNDNQGNKPPEPEQKSTQDKSSGGASGDQDKDPEGSGHQEFDEHSGGSEAPPPPLDQAEVEELSIQWQQRMAGAAQQAQQAGKLSGVMKRLVDKLLQANLPWRMLLARYMTAVARDDYSYTRPSTRRGDPAIFPTLKSTEINVLVALDVSGSVSDKELRECLSEINAIKGQMRARITLVACDSDIIEGFPQVFEPWEEVTLPDTLLGGGTTDFRPVFNWISQQDHQPNTVVYFTDALGQFPIEPNYPVVWLIKGKGEVPWGQRVQLN
jgi:predicted metal-dependent peptidase